MDTSMYDRLLKLPLFQGLSRNDLTEILEKVKVEFRNFAPNEYLAKQDDSCSELLFVINGRIRVCTRDKKHKFSLYETIDGDVQDDVLIEPSSLFGLRTSLWSSYKAETSTNVLVIKKSYILPLLCNYEIFNLNYFNVLSIRAQDLQQKIWDAHIGNTLQKIVSFLTQRCVFGSGPKELNIKMRDLAFLLNDTRNNISGILNYLQEKGYVELSRKVIKVNNLADLVLEAEKNVQASVSEQ